MTDVLSQNEIDALLHGVDSGDVETEQDQPKAAGEVVSYDFNSKDHITRSRFPTLEMINERFARNFRLSLFEMLRQPVEFNIEGIEIKRYSDYTQSLFVPTSLNMIRCKPLRGTGMVMIESNLVFSVVDIFFGGKGKSNNKVEGRDFTDTEKRVISLLLESAFELYSNSWSAVFPLEFEYQYAEINPQFATIVNPAEMVVVCQFSVNLDGIGGNIHFVLPYAMLEPVRELLQAGKKTGQNEDDADWQKGFHEGIRAVTVPGRCVLAEATISMQELSQLKSGDVIPIELSEKIALIVERIPVSMGQFGASKGRNALKITERLKRRDVSSPSLLGVCDE